MRELSAIRSVFLSVAMFLTVFLCGNPIASASGYDGEYTYETGVSLLFSDVDFYELSDTSLAEVVRKGNGERRIRLQRPGDLVVTVRFRGGAVGRYLMHIHGHAVDETAVNRESFAQEILDLVNRERAKKGSGALRLADDMMKAADIRAGELVRLFSHTRPDGRSCFTVLRNQGNGAGENIAAGAASPEAVMRMWMNSPGHKRNILDPHYRELGVGYTYQGRTKYRHFWVQLFRS